jgi:hypothetical protein
MALDLTGDLPIANAQPLTKKEKRAAQPRTENLHRQKNAILRQGPNPDFGTTTAYATYTTAPKFMNMMDNQAIICQPATSQKTPRDRALRGRQGPSLGAIEPVEATRAPYIRHILSISENSRLTFPVVRKMVSAGARRRPAA